MASVFDVAAFILRERGQLPPMKLQQLVYYSQAWSLVWDQPPDAPLFHERLEAWAYGPVSPDLYAYHRDKIAVDVLPVGDPEALTARQRQTVQATLAYYADRPTGLLHDLVQLEAPWRDARVGCAEGEQCTREITVAAMQAYYSGISPND